MRKSQCLLLMVKRSYICVTVPLSTPELPSSHPPKRPVKHLGDVCTQPYEEDGRNKTVYKID